ncbi:hypothetical protein Fcan01_15535 [Folsomia candida]|uniref:O-acyltransferase WSD1 C-terminal domain-containing protein n=1 Tax=Folsomia candida TaxID=158441 RepID=A0A226DW03_FOLCA|nr:hypothetical protein Fcan01_15535 [Folsomia candida]
MSAKPPSRNSDVVLGGDFKNRHHRRRMSKNDFCHVGCLLKGLVMYARSTRVRCQNGAKMRRGVMRYNVRKLLKDVGVPQRQCRNLDLTEFIHHINKTWISCRDDASQNLRYPELQQYPVNWAGYKFWKWEENFSLQNHIRLAPSGGDLTQMVVDLLSGTFPEGTSPWDFTIVPGHILQGEEHVTMIFLRIHHLLGDGFMVHFLLQRLWGDENPAPLFRPGVKRKNSVWYSAKHFILFPYKAILLFGELAHSAVTRTIWKVPERRKGLTWSLARGQSIPTRTIFRIKNHFQVSFSAVLFSLVAGGLSRFMDSELKQGAKIPDIVPTVTSIASGGKHPDQSGNHFSFGLIAYPTGISDPVERLYEMHHNFETLRHSAAAIIGYYGFVLLGSHVNWVGRRVNSYPFGSLVTSH